MASLDKVANTLYIREGVRLVGEDTLSGNDVLEHVNFPNTIAYGSYPIDLQATQKGDYGCALCGRCLYSIPLGCMIPKGTDNILVLGRSASFDILSHGSARTVPVLMSMAENGIIAMDYSLKNHLSMKELNRSSKDLAALYKYLNNTANFEKLTLSKSDLDERWYYPYIHDLISKGYFGFGYSWQDLNSRKNTKKTLNTILTLFSTNSSYAFPEAYANCIHCVKDTLSIEELCQIASYLLDDNVTSLDDLYSKNIIDKVAYDKVQHDAPLSHAEVAVILDCIIKKIDCYTPIVLYKDSISTLSE
jgi:hypothetical protein